MWLRYCAVCLSACLLYAQTEKPSTLSGTVSDAMTGATLRKNDGRFAERSFSRSKEFAAGVLGQHGCNRHVQIRKHRPGRLQSQRLGSRISGELAKYIHGSSPR